MPRDDKTKISNDGLRYKSKTGGSPFGTEGRTGDTMTSGFVASTNPEVMALLSAFLEAPPSSVLTALPLKRRPRWRLNLQHRAPTVDHRAARSTTANPLKKGVTRVTPFF